MAFFTVAFTVLVWAIGIGFAVSIAIFVPLTLYVIPYELWVGNEQQMGRQKDKRKEKAFQAAKNATKLYSAWIHHRKPSL